MQRMGCITTVLLSYPCHSNPLSPSSQPHMRLKSSPRRPAATMCCQAFCWRMLLSAASLLVPRQAALARVPAEVILLPCSATLSHPSPALLAGPRKLPHPLFLLHHSKACVSLAALGNYSSHSAAQRCSQSPAVPSELCAGS